MNRILKLMLVVIIFTLPLDNFYFFIGFSLKLNRLAFFISLILFIIISFQNGKFNLLKSFLGFYFLLLFIINLIISLFAYDISLSLQTTFTYLNLYIFVKFLRTNQSYMIMYYLFMDTRRKMGELWLGFLTNCLNKIYLLVVKG